MSSSVDYSIIHNEGINSLKLQNNEIEDDINVHPTISDPDLCDSSLFYQFDSDFNDFPR